MKILKKVFALFAAVGIVFSLTACAPEKMDMTSVTQVIDVRTAAEYASGHLQGAVNIDVNSGDFDQQIAALDPAGKYVIYCKSGNRAGQAIERMTALGFTDLTNAGGLVNAASVTGLAIVE